MRSRAHLGRGGGGGAPMARRNRCCNDNEHPGSFTPTEARPVLWQIILLLLPVNVLSLRVTDNLEEIKRSTTS